VGQGAGSRDPVLTVCGSGRVKEAAYNLKTNGTNILIFPIFLKKKTVSKYYNL
jgi:hypothetical protein